MDNNQFGPVLTSNKKALEWVGFGCSCLGCLLTVIFSIVTCARGGKIFIDNKGEFKMSKWIIGVIIAVILAIAGAVVSILSIERGTAIRDISKITTISLIVAAIAIFWAIVPNATICGYNCVFNDKIKG